MCYGKVKFINNYKENLWKINHQKISRGKQLIYPV